VTEARRSVICRPNLSVSAIATLSAPRLFKSDSSLGRQTKKPKSACGFGLHVRPHSCAPDIPLSKHSRFARSRRTHCREERAFPPEPSAPKFRGVASGPSDVSPLGQGGRRTRSRVYLYA